MQNAKGRLVRATTCFSNCATIPTDLAFSYSARGELTDAWEYTQHSGGVYYHLTQTYWESGAPKQLSGLPGLPAITYGGTIGATVGLDGEGRFTQVTAATGQNPVTGVTFYNSGSTQPIGALTQVNFGSGDNDQFSYDVNTRRLTNYTFNVGSNPVKTDSGTLTWNANGSLQKLVIADTVPGAIDNQTCNYTHDDLGRIASANCGATQNQSFAFDPFGNITKTALSGVGNFTVGYDQTKNRVQNAAYTYDNNGCLLNDGTGGGYQYTWDAEGRLASVTAGGSTVSLTYDALGRLVEQQRGTSYTQVVYRPTGGKLALMNGQTLSKAFVPLPGGATAVYNSSGLAYYRHTDWLGSSRLATTPTRTVYYDVAYAPYGENYGGSGTTDLDFTGQNQDTVSGLYDFMFRRYSPGQGRWILPDPAGRAAVSMTNPQSWNRYAYVANRPLSSIDPLGLYICTDCPPPPPDDGGSSGGDDGGGGGPGFGHGFIEPLLDGNGGDGGDEGITPAVNLRRLTDCLSSLNVTLLSFTPPVYDGGDGFNNKDGSFTGLATVAADNYSYNQITITNNYRYYSLLQIFLKTQNSTPYQEISPNPLGRGGFTDIDHPYENYTARNISSGEELNTQIYELGNSLAVIAGQFDKSSKPNSPKDDPGNLLLDCYTQSH